MTIPARALRGENHGAATPATPRSPSTCRAQSTPGRTPNKGEFLLGNKRYCYPLTITDYKTRYLLACDALDSTKEAYAITAVFERTFREFGLPTAIRTDNGTPFASRTSSPKSTITTGHTRRSA
jgi:transposase InsO family protein